MNIPNSWNIRKFLLQQPRASVVRLVSNDSDPQEIKTDRCKSWSKVADTVLAVAPEVVELLDSKGNLIRAWRFEEFDQPRSNEKAPVPEVISNDPETARLTHFADLLHRAYEFSTELAFNKLVDLVERIDARSDSIEQRLERAEAAHRRAMNDRLEDAWDRVEEKAEEAGTPDLKDQIMASWMQGAMQGKGAKPPPPNGAGNNGKG